MKYLRRNVYLIFLLTIFLQIDAIAYSKEIKFKHTSGDIYNYFSGIVALNEDDTTRGFNYLKKVQSLRDKHFNFNVHYLRTLILLGKFDEAFVFSKKIWVKDQLFFEADLLLGLDSFLNKDYSNAQKYFKRLNKISINNIYFEDFLGNA